MTPADRSPAPRRPPHVGTILRRLQKAYGPRPWRARGRPLDSLIGTILSQHTSDRNTDAAMERLKARFDTWVEAADASPAQIAAAIRPAGLHRRKAATIRTVLRQIRDARGQTDLGFLRRWPTTKVRDYLLALPGVGPKTAACVLMFCLKRPVLPVDTHVHRVSRRLGLIGPKTTAEQAHDVLAEMVPDEKVYAFHMLLIQHGRQVCHARRPDHAACCLRDVCPSADL